MRGFVPKRSLRSENRGTGEAVVPRTRRDRNWSQGKEEAVRINSRYYLGAKVFFILAECSARIPTHGAARPISKFSGSTGLNVNTEIMLIFWQWLGHRDIRHPGRSPRFSARPSPPLSSCFIFSSSSFAPHDYANV